MKWLTISESAIIKMLFHSTLCIPFRRRTELRIRDLSPTTVGRYILRHEDPPVFVFVVFFSVAPVVIHAMQPDFGPNVTVFDPGRVTN